MAQGLAPSGCTYLAGELSTPGSVLWTVHVNDYWGCLVLGWTCAQHLPVLWQCCHDFVRICVSRASHCMYQLLADLHVVVLGKVRMRSSTGLQ